MSPTWLLLVSLGVAALGTRTAARYHRTCPPRERHGAYLLLFLSWMPLVAWAFNAFGLVSP